MTAGMCIRMRMRFLRLFRRHDMQGGEQEDTEGTEVSDLVGSDVLFQNWTAAQEARHLISTQPFSFP